MTTKNNSENPFKIESGLIVQPCGRKLLMEQVHKMEEGEGIFITKELQEKYDIKEASIRSSITQQRHLKRRFKIQTETRNDELVLVIYCLANRGKFLDANGLKSSCI